MDVDVPYLLPSPSTVRQVFMNLASSRREEYKHNFPCTIIIGGDLRYDGLKLEASGRKYYDLIVHNK